VAVVARDPYGNLATGYTGTVHFSSSDGQAALPANYAFTAADAGTHTFSNGATLKTAGTQSVTATDTVTGSITGTESGIVVNPGVANKLVVSGFPSPTMAGAAHNLNVTAKDAYGNTATGYRGTVAFSSSDGQAVLPGNHTFTAGDAGSYTGSSTLMTQGTQWLASTDMQSGGPSGNEPGIVVNAVGSGPYSIWSNSTTPGLSADPDTNAVEVGVKFRSDVAGSITALRFYKDATNTGTHVGHLWSSAGQLLATATFTGETASGWQQVSLSSPVAISPNTTYIVSYHTNVGHYSADEGYFANSGVNNGPLHALANGADGPDGVYHYGSAAFPTNTYHSTNYWVDIVFSAASAPTPPTVTGATPTGTGVAVTTTVTATFSEDVQPATISFVLRDPGGNSVPATQTYSVTTHTATLTPSAALLNATTYTATVSGAQDASGTPMASAYTWSFTTAPAGDWHQASAADFNAGTQSGTAVADPTNGGLQLAPAFFDDFNRTSLGAAWTSSTWTSGGTTTLSGGILSVVGAEAVSAQTVGTTPVEARVSFGASTYQHFGLATDLSSVSGNSWAIFSTNGTTNTLFARVNVGGSTNDVSLGALPSGYHVYRVQPVAGAVRFYVDGTLKTTIPASFASGVPLRIALSAYNNNPRQPLKVDWVRLASYPASGTFTSAVYDAGRLVTWGTALWTVNLPAGTTITVQTRSGNSAAPDSTWSAWAPVSNNGTVSSPASRYLQYRVVLTTPDPTLTPVLLSIDFNWS
jgi:hypothetical protein